MGFKPRIVKEADGPASALAFVAAGFGVAAISEPLQKIPAKDVIFRIWLPRTEGGCLLGPPGNRMHYRPVASQFIDLLAQTCANGNGGVGHLGTLFELMAGDFRNEIPNNVQVLPCSRVVVCARICISYVM